jgi:hypothetical protein
MLQDVDVSARYLVLASAAAVLSYIEHIQNVNILGHSMRIVWQAAEGRMVRTTGTVTAAAVILWPPAGRAPPPVRRSVR